MSEDLNVVMRQNEEMKRLLLEEVLILESWAHESEAGSWSTHQVHPQRTRANEIKVKLVNLGVLR